MREMVKRRRCAIYTRVSTDHGLEQDFNSLDNQREASKAYVRSQAGEGWVLLKAPYDDGGFSGGSLDRPALQQLLAEIRRGRVDVVVVYKVDRLTRSLADFAKLVELFDQHGVSFVSVTQSFNTTTSMGRLTLNVLLSFAQFEREVTSERIRDKIAASKKRGIWVGGMVPLGYVSRDKKLVVIEEEAERVRLIFQRYLELGSLGLLLTDLRCQGVHTKARQLASDKVAGGIPFTRGSLAYLLRNRFYIGEVVYKGAVCPAEHPPILDRALFEAVQERLTIQRNGTKSKHIRSGALLSGRIFDDRGNRMTPTTAVKQGIHYRYYVSSALAQGRPQDAGTVTRVAALEIERIVLETVRGAVSVPDLDDAALIASHLGRATIEQDAIAVQVAFLSLSTDSAGPDTHEPARSTAVRIPWSVSKQLRHRELIASAPQVGLGQPIRSETRTVLLQAIARGRLWLDEIASGRVASSDEIAKRECCSVRQVNRTLSLAFMAPDLVKAAVQGTLPQGIGLRRMIDPPLEWSRQRSALGLRA